MSRVVMCPVCSCPVQRIDEGTLAAGMRRHSQVVHPESIVVVVARGGQLHYELEDGGDVT